MIDLKDLNSAQLDAIRRYSGPFGGSELQLMKSNPVRGYDLLQVVADGWCVEDSDVGGFQTLLIAETDRVGEEVLDQAEVFTIDGVLYSVEGVTRKIRPSPGTKMPRWKFIISPIGGSL